MTALFNLFRRRQPTTWHRCVAFHLMQAESRGALR